MAYFEHLRLDLQNPTILTHSPTHLASVYTCGFLHVQKKHSAKPIHINPVALSKKCHAIPSQAIHATPIKGYLLLLLL